MDAPRVHHRFEEDQQIFIRFVNITAHTEDWRPGSVVEQPLAVGLHYTVIDDAEGLFYHVLERNLRDGTNNSI